MKYAITETENGVETVVRCLPLSIVPFFDPENPIQDNTYGVPDDVQVGWIKVGGVFVPPPPKPVTTVPQRVEMAQARLALHESGYLSVVETAMAAMPKDAQIEWEFRTSVNRQSPLVAAMASLLQLTDAQMDELFVLAATK